LTGQPFSPALSPQERAVQALYLDALGRAGSKAELDGWVGLLPAGATALTPTVVSGIEGSFEAQDHLVKTWYVTYLGRQAQGGEEMWAVNMLRGDVNTAPLSEEQVLAKLLSGPEFATRAQMLIGSGTSDECFVQALYQVLLGRTASDAEVAGWVSALPQLGRTGVAQGFLGSQEFRGNQFEGYYNALLHRPDDPAGLNGWVMSNLGMHTVRLGFEASPEFFANS
jgi:hypothetical protein